MKIRAVHVEPPAISAAPWPGLSLFLDGGDKRGKLTKGGARVLRPNASKYPPASAQRLRVFCACDSALAWANLPPRAEDIDTDLARLCPRASSGAVGRRGQRPTAVVSETPLYAMR